MTRLAWLRLAAYAAVVAVGVAGFWIDHAQDLDRCRTRNDATRTAVQIGAEALIEVADADPETVKRYRANLDRRLRDAEVDCT